MVLTEQEIKNFFSLVRDSLVSIFNLLDDIDVNEDIFEELSDQIDELTKDLIKFG